MTDANDLLRFVLEVAGVVAAAFWGSHTTPNGVARIVLGLAAAAVLIVVWTLVVSPGAYNPLSPTVRELVGSALLLLTAAGLLAVGQRTAAAIYAALIVLNTIVMLALGG